MDDVWPIPKQGPKPKAPRRGLARGKRLAPVSAKRKAENLERREALMETFGRYPDCQACPIIEAGGHRLGTRYPRHGADDGHELLRRSQGGSITDPDGIMPVCRTAHEWVGANITEAKRLGLHLSRT